MGNMATTDNPRPLTHEDLRYALEHYATKADVSELKADLIKWMVVLQFLGLGAIAAIIKFLS